MPSLIELRVKINGVKSTQQITKAMKMIASVKLARVQIQVADGRAFLNKLNDLVYDLTRKPSETEIPDDRERSLNAVKEHPLQIERDSRGIGLVVLTSDKGLCGAFNNNVIHKSLEFVRANAGKEMKIFAVGKKANDYFNRNNIKLERSYVHLGKDLAFAHALELANDLMQGFYDAKFSRAYAIYTESKSVMRQKVVQAQLLPIVASPPVTEHKAIDYLFEPERDCLLESLIPLYFRSRVFYLLLESYLSEVCARMTAMDNASRNAQDLIDSLTLFMNKIRQANITRELIEIVGAGEAIKGQN